MFQIIFRGIGFREMATGVEKCCYRMRAISHSDGVNLRGSVVLLLPPSPSSSSSLFLFFMNAGDWRQQKVGPKKLFLEATKSFKIFNETTERAKS